MTKFVYVFDLDDTLYLERDYIRSGFRHVGELAAARYGLQDMAERAWTLFEQGVRGNTFNLLARELSLPDEAVELFVAEYRQHEPKIELLGDAQCFLDRLPVDVVGTGIITDGDSMGQWRKIRALGLDERVDHVVVTADHGISWAKPSEYAFRLVETKFAPSELEFVYFGDNPTKDFQAPHRLGWRTVRLRRPQGLHYSVDVAGDAELTISQFPSSMCGDVATFNDQFDEQRVCPS